MTIEASIPHNPETLDNETVKTTAGDLIHDFNLALRKLPALKGRFKILDEPLDERDLFVRSDQLVDKLFADYGVFVHNGTSYTFEGLGNPEMLWLHGSPQITEPVDFLTLPESLRDGEYPHLFLDVSFPRILWTHRVIKGGEVISREEFENTSMAIERARGLLQVLQSPTPTLPINP